MMIPFYMYTGPNLDFSWLGKCPKFDSNVYSSHDLNYAEVAAYQHLASHPWRLNDSRAALLFYVPLWEYTSYTIGNCLNTSHAGRMRRAAHALRSLAPWQRKNGSDHFFVTTAFSMQGHAMTLRNRLTDMNALIGIVGRYKARLPAVSMGGRKSFPVPYPTHKQYKFRHAHRLRHTFAYFAGSLDVCCTGARIRCQLADIMESDVVIKPILRTASSKGRCSKRYEERTGWTVPVVSHDDVDADSRMMQRAVYCFTPAGDNCISGRFYNAIANGCIPVVSCAMEPAFRRIVPYKSMMVRIYDTQNATSIMRTLHAISKDRIESMQAAIKFYAPHILYDQNASSNILAEAFELTKSN